MARGMQPPKQHNPSPPTMKRPHFGAPGGYGMPAAPRAGGQPHFGSPSTPGATPATPGGGGLPHFARKGK